MLGKFNGLDDLSSFSDDLGLNICLELVESIPLRAEFLILHIVELLHSAIIVGKLVHEVIL
jgi:hypothetical protein